MTMVPTISTSVPPELALMLIPPGPVRVGPPALVATTPASTLLFWTKPMPLPAKANWLPSSLLPPDCAMATRRMFSVALMVSAEDFTLPSLLRVS